MKVSNETKLSVLLAGMGVTLLLQGIDLIQRGLFVRKLKNLGCTCKK